MSLLADNANFQDFLLRGLIDPGVARIVVYRGVALNSPEYSFTCQQVIFQCSIDCSCFLFLELCVLSLCVFHVVAAPLLRACTTARDAYYRSLNCVVPLSQGIQRRRP